MLPSRSAILSGLLLVAFLQAPAWADDKDELRRLDAIAALSDASNEAALQQLVTLKASIGPGASYEVRKELLLLEARIQYDAGHLAQAYAANDQLLTLAQAQHDAAGVILARLGEADRLLDQNKAEEALAFVQKLKPQGQMGPQVEAAIHLELGRIYNTLARFEQALTHFLAALTVADSMPRGAREVRMIAYQNASRLYVNTKNPDKALLMVHKALDTVEGAPAKTLANLYNTEGSALIALGRGREGLAALKRSLDMARRDGLDTLAAKVMGKMSDAYLRQKDYLAAEKMARQGLALAQQINERNSLLMAKANLGFALAGQGKVNEARPYVDEVIAEFRKASSLRNLEAMLDETGRMYEDHGLYQQALKTVREQLDLRAKVYDAERARAVAALQESFDANTRTRQIELLARENRLKDAELQNRRLQQIVTLLGAGLTLITGGVVYALYRRVRKANSKLQDLNSQLAFHATRDPLTGLYNRRSFIEMMQAKAQAVAPAPGAVDCITLMDIDHFKRINDEWGHGVGDQVLVEVAARLTRAVRDSDMVLRWGGEEFLVYSSRAKADQLVVMVKRMLDEIGSTPVPTEAGPVPVTVSAGFISWPFSDVSAAELGWEKVVQLADQGLYLGKQRGRNRAYGLMRLRPPIATALAAIQLGLEQAEQSGDVELAEVLGPGPIPARASVLQLA